MKFFAFTISVLTGAAILAFGVLLRYHVETILTIFAGSDLPNETIPKAKYDQVLFIVRVIGFLLIMIGIFIAFSSLFSLMLF